MSETTIQDRIRGYEARLLAMDMDYEARVIMSMRLEVFGGAR